MAISYRETLNAMKTTLAKRERARECVRVCGRGKKRKTRRRGGNTPKKGDKRMDSDFICSVNIEFILSLGIIHLVGE